jgi:hypothetical protein
MAGLDELDLFLLKKIGMLSHCGFENDMTITYSNITKELMCAMRVHLMNESEIHVFCPKEARVWEDNCLNVEFMNYTAISPQNELNVLSALKSSIHTLIGSYPTNIQDDSKILLSIEEGNAEYGPIMSNAIKLRYREKEILYSAISYLEDYESAVHNGSVTFQLELKAKEREEANIRQAEHEKFVEEVKAKAALRSSLATLEVDLGNSQPKANLTIVEGDDIQQTILSFMQKNNIQKNYYETLYKALKGRIVNPPPLQLLLGVVTPIGDRQILGIPEGTNATVETGVFCAKFDNSKDVLESKWCKGLMERVEKRLFNLSFQRKIILKQVIDAPDTRKLTYILYEGKTRAL